MFNVRDGEGKHIGFVYGQVGTDWLVALSDSSLDNSRINWDLVKSWLADIYSTRNFLGRVKEDTLLNTTKDAWDHGDAGDNNFHPSSPEDYYKFYVLKHHCALNKCLDTEDMTISGYTFLDGSTLSFCDGDLLLQDTLDYVEVRVLDSPPIHGQVSDYPRIGITAMSEAEGILLGASLSEFGGRNHTHLTRVRIKSGNVEKVFSFPLQIGFKKGYPVQIFLTEDGEITSVFHDGALYVMNISHVPGPTYTFD